MHHTKGPCRPWVAARFAPLPTSLRNTLRALLHPQQVCLRVHKEMQLRL